MNTGSSYQTKHTTLGYLSKEIKTFTQSPVHECSLQVYSQQNTQNLNNLQISEDWTNPDLTHPYNGILLEYLKGELLLHVTIWMDRIMLCDRSQISQLHILFHLYNTLKYQNCGWQRVDKWDRDSGCICVGCKYKEEGVLLWWQNCSKSWLWWW